MLIKCTLLPWAGFRGTRPRKEFMEQLAGDGAATEAGRAHREAVERQTDLLALTPLEALGEEGCLRLRELIRPMSAAIASLLLPR
jgi:Helix-turn-helix family